MRKSVNIQEEIVIREEYIKLSQELSRQILEKRISPIDKIVLAVGGESGSGKTTTALCLEKVLNTRGIGCTTIHMDSYFKLPPRENHQKRKSNLSNVGPQEINMDLLDRQILEFKSNKSNLKIPVVNYKTNEFTNENLDLKNINILIVEGVFSFLLQNVDHKIFLGRSYKETLENRRKRTRENYDPIVELILEIEHKIVSPHKKHADFIINKDYTLNTKD